MELELNLLVVVLRVMPGDKLQSPNIKEMLALF
jgi:hypothetical protein